MTRTSDPPKPLLQKLGLTPAMRVVLIAPATTLVDAVARAGHGPRIVETSAEVTERGYDYVHLFTGERRVLAAALPQLRAAIVANGMIWVSWPKRAARVATDLDENVVRQLALAHDLVDVKVCAIDPIWSGLKLVIPLAKRTRD